MVDTQHSCEPSSEEKLHKLESIRKFVQDYRAGAEDLMSQHGTPYAAIFEYAVELDEMLTGHPEDVDRNLLAWYQVDGNVQLLDGLGDLFSLVGDYLLAAGLISEERQKPVARFSGTAAEITQGMRKALADPNIGTPKDRTFWQSVVGSEPL